MAGNKYDSGFFDYHAEGARQSARETIPLLLEFVQPKSVVDLGCGTGAWLAEFRAAGIDDVQGFDGDYVDRGQLLIGPERFTPHDLSRPLALDREFDLAISLEVAEHLPQEVAGTFVESLTRLAPVVLFSAAIPFQNGSGHINLQWPEYWQQHFARHDYVVVDCLREPLWRNTNVKSWYSQNMLLFVRRDRLADYPRLASAFQAAGENPRLAMVHPEQYAELVGALYAELNKTQKTVMHLGLGLRQFNLVAFPDWDQPPEVNAAQLRPLFAAVAAHPERRQMALVVSIGDRHAAAASPLVAQWIAEALSPGGRTIADAPLIDGIKGDCGADQWRAILACMQGRVLLAHEDAAGITQAGADPLPAISTSQIASRQSLVPE